MIDEYLREKMLENWPEDALGTLVNLLNVVKSVLTVLTDWNVLLYLLKIWKSIAYLLTYSLTYLVTTWKQEMLAHLKNGVPLKKMDFGAKIRISKKSTFYRPCSGHQCEKLWKQKSTVFGPISRFWAQCKKNLTRVFEIEKSRHALLRGPCGPKKYMCIQYCVSGQIVESAWAQLVYLEADSMHYAH